jgi:hypothetical protein
LRIKNKCPFPTVWEHSQQKVEIMTNRIFLTAVVAFFELVLSTPVFAQKPKSTNQLQKEYFNRVAKSKEDWAHARKLTNRKDLDTKSLPQPKIQGKEIDALELGEIESAAYWAFKVQAVVDSENCILSLGKSKAYWLTGYPTATLADGMVVHLVDPVIVEASREFANPIDGKRTLRTLRMLPANESERWETERFRSIPKKEMAINPIDKGNSVELKGENKPLAATAGDRPNTVSEGSVDKQWINKSYKTVLKKVADGKWHEVKAETGEVVWHLDELRATADYVELFLVERKQTIRVFADKMQLIEGNSSKDVAYGFWQSTKDK